MQENSIEKKLCKLVKQHDGIPYKFVSPGKRGVPDRLCLFPVPKQFREIVNTFVRFIELKAPGEKLKPHQQREHARLKKLGYDVKVIDNV